MKCFILSLCFLMLISFAISAQQLPLYSQYIENAFLLNPAIAGSKQYSPLRLSVRQQWMGVAGAPNTQTLSYNTNLGESCTSCPVTGNPLVYRNNKSGVGLGGYLFNDSYGSVSRTGLELCYAYHLRLTAKRFGVSPVRMSFGLGGLFYQYSFDGSEIPEDDPLYTGSRENSFIPDANFGLYIYNDDFFIGFSVAHIFESSVRLGDDFTDGDLMKRHLYAIAGYTFHLSEFMSLEPALILRRTIDSDNYFDVSSKLYVQNIWIALSYRSNNQLIGMVGVSYEQFYFGYSYDYYSDNLIADNSNGTHEITLGLNLNVSQKRFHRSRNRKFIFF